MSDPWLTATVEEREALAALNRQTALYLAAQARYDRAKAAIRSLNAETQAAPDVLEPPC